MQAQQEMHDSLWEEGIHQDDPCVGLGMLLRSLRHSIHRNVESIAAALQLSQEEYRELEAGKNAPTYDQVAYLVDESRHRNPEWLNESKVFWLNTAFKRACHLHADRIFEDALHAETPLQGLSEMLRAYRISEGWGRGDIARVMRIAESEYRLVENAEALPSVVRERLTTLSQEVTADSWLSNVRLQCMYTAVGMVRQEEASKKWNNAENLRQRIKALRHATGMTTKQFAEVVGMDWGQYLGIESEDETARPPTAWEQEVPRIIAAIQPHVGDWLDREKEASLLSDAHEAPTPMIEAKPLSTHTAGGKRILRLELPIIAPPPIPSVQAEPVIHRDDTATLPRVRRVSTRPALAQHRSDPKQEAATKSGQKRKTVKPEKATRVTATVSPVQGERSKGARKKEPEQTVTLPLLPPLMPAGDVEKTPAPSSAPVSSSPENAEPKTPRVWADPIRDKWRHKRRLEEQEEASRTAAMIAAERAAEEERRRASRILQVKSEHRMQQLQADMDQLCAGDPEEVSEQDALSLLMKGVFIKWGARGMIYPPKDAAFDLNRIAKGRRLDCVFDEARVEQICADVAGVSESEKVALRVWIAEQAQTGELKEMLDTWQCFIAQPKPVEMVPSVPEAQVAISPTDESVEKPVLAPEEDAGAVLAEVLPAAPMEPQEVEEVLEPEVGTNNDIESPMMAQDAPIVSAPGKVVSDASSWKQRPKRARLPRPDELDRNGKLVLTPGKFRPTSPKHLTEKHPEPSEVVEFLPSLGVSIAEIRHQCGIGKDDMASAVGVFPAVLDAWESDQQKPSQMEMERIIAALISKGGQQCSDELLDGFEEVLRKIRAQEAEAFLSQRQDGESGVKAIRLATGLSVEEMAEILLLSPEDYVASEAGRQEFTEGQLGRMFQEAQGMNPRWATREKATQLLPGSVVQRLSFSDETPYQAGQIIVHRGTGVISRF